MKSYGGSDPRGVFLLGSGWARSLKAKRFRSEIRACRYALLYYHYVTLPILLNVAGIIVSISIYVYTFNVFLRIVNKMGQN